MGLISDQELIDHPYDCYLALHERLIKHGPNAPFPEFKPAVDRILERLESPKFQSLLGAHPDLEFEVKEVKAFFAHINLKFTFDDESAYPYSRPFLGPFPYRPTLDAIESGLRLLDKLNRLEPGNQAVPLYHFDRYAYHRHALVADPAVVLWPTIRDLSFYDLIRVRSVPLGFLGVVTETIRVDRHWQSPLDFWYHDLNHVRRMYEYIRLRFRQDGIVSESQMARFYKEMDDFIVNTIVPNVADLPAGATDEEVAVRRLVRTIIFEIFHETALTAEKTSIIEDILRPSGPQPFEHMVAPNEEIDPEQIEKLRTPTGNLASGSSLVKNEGNQPVTVRFFFDRSLALLANVYNKLNFGFYDDPDSPSELVVPVEFRTYDHVVRAAQEVFKFLGIEQIPDTATLMALTITREGAEEKFIYKGTANKEGRDEQYATDPISAEKIINEIKALGKRVHTLFGYSLLEYQEPAAVMEAIQSELQELDPQTTLINIGATEEGIGAAYKVAKELGFATVGIVSTQALSYSGKFSEHVDRIYIVNDMLWGGYVPGTQKLAETTKAYLGVSDAISAYGGGENTAVILKLGHELGIPLRYTPAQMNHKVAREVKRCEEIDFDGPALKVWRTLQGLD